MLGHWIQKHRIFFVFLKKKVSCTCFSEKFVKKKKFFTINLFLINLYLTNHSVKLCDVALKVNMSFNSELKMETCILYVNVWVTKPVLPLINK